MNIYNTLLEYPDICARYAIRYINFINTRPKNRELEYAERHHVLPRSLFPQHEHDPDNITVLNAREHYLAHRLLVKVFPKSSQMRYAFWCMCNGWKNGKQGRVTPEITSRIYSEIKSLVLLDMIKRGENLNNDVSRQKAIGIIRERYGAMGNASEIIFEKQKQTMLELYGYENIFQTPEFIEENKQRVIQRNRDPEYRKTQGKKIAKALESVDRKGENNSFYGKTHSDETKEKISAAKLGASFPKFSCTCCHKVLGVNNFTQHMRSH